MRDKEFIVEGTEIHTADGEVFAKRTSRGKGNPPAVRMFITKDEWENIKGQQANTETMDYDVATAESAADSRNKAKAVSKQAMKVIK